MNIIDPPRDSKNTAAATATAALEAQVEGLLQHTLDTELTQEYHRALEVIPDLVRLESKISDFLRAEHNQPQATAERIARYWKLRKTIFGDRWLLPMTQTGSGALTASNIEILRTGFVKIVDTPTLGLVTVADFSYLPAGCPHVQPEVAFYLSSVFAIECIVLYVVRGQGKHNMEMNDAIRRIEDSTATRHTARYVVQAYEEGRQHLLDFLGYQQRRVSENNLQARITAHIVGTSVADTLHKLQQVGFDKSCIPVELGGDLTKQMFDQWVQRRLSIEETLGKAAILRSHLGAAIYTSHAVADTDTAVQGLVVPKQRIKRGKEYPALVKRPDETDEQFQKRKNACYVRRNYHRQKLEALAIEGEAARCVQVNTALKADNARLEQLLTDATALVQFLEQHTTAKPPPSSSPV